MHSKNPRHGKQPATSTKTHVCLAKGEEVPTHLIGRPYRSFTTAEWWEIKKHRRATNTCQGCGHNKYRSFGRVQRHHFSECPLRKKINNYRRENNLCLDCGAEGHQWEDCPVQKRLEAELAPFATDYHEVPKEYRDWSYSAITKDDLQEILSWRLKHEACTERGSRQHSHYACEKRWERVREEHEARLAAIASGDVVLDTNFNGPLSKLPAELLKEILLIAARERGDDVGSLKVKHGYLNTVKRLVRAGLPLDEVIEGFTRANVFHLSPSSYCYNRHPGSMAMFQSFLQTFQAFKHVRAVHLDNHTIELPKLLLVCPKIKKLKLTVYAQTVEDWQEPWLHGGHITLASDKVPSFADILDVPLL